MSIASMETGLGPVVIHGAACSVGGVATRPQSITAPGRREPSRAMRCLDLERAGRHWVHEVGMSDELMPCPFCGGEARILEDITGDYLWPDRFVVECSNEHCMASSMWSTRERVVFAWNRRAPAPTPIGRGLTPLPESSDGVP